MGTPILNKPKSSSSTPENCENSVQSNRLGKQNNPEELQFLISKWRKSSQAILYELQSALLTDNKKLSLTQLIDSFGLDDKLLHYIRTNEDFTDP